jgi:heptosyltransferase-2
LNILVIRGGALGDFLLTLPAVAGLRQKWPEARIEMVANARFGELVEGPGRVDAVRPIDRPGLAGFFAQGGVLEPDWGDYFSEFDLTLSYFFDPDGIFESNWRRAGGQGEYLGINPTGPQVAAWKHLAKPLQLRGIRPGMSHLLRGKILTTQGEPFARPGAAPRVVIHPGSGGTRKCWPLEGWITELAVWQKEQPMELVWLAGEVEGDLLRRVPEGMRGPPHRTVENRPLPEVFRLLQSSDLYLGHDSGISHLAAWSGVPCGLLFGPTDPNLWAPPGSHVRVWHRGGRWPERGELARWWREELGPLLVIKTARR